MNGNYCLDANIFIANWEVTYPEDIFPALWREIAERKTDIILVKPIFDEIVPSPLRTWLEEHRFGAMQIDDTVSQKALELEGEYEIKLATKGVNANDIMLIAYARVYKKIVVTYEARQSRKEPPNSKSSYKIPLVCDLENVECINFVDLLKKWQIRI